MIWQVYNETLETNCILDKNNFIKQSKTLFSMLITKLTSSWF